MRRIALPMSLLAFACSSDDTSVTASEESTGSSGSESSTTASTTEPTSTTNPSTTDDTSVTMTDPSTSSSEDTNPETTMPPEETGPAYVCGDGMIEDIEQCEGTDFGANSCMTQGFMQGELVCSGDCLGFSTENCFTCGNDLIEGTEECDGELANNIDCESEGYTEGEITCVQETCQYDVSQCTLCGDNVAEGNEQCDNDDFGGATCETIGFTGGSLDCNSKDCEIVVAGCTGGAFTADFETGTFPAQFSQDGDADWIVDGTSPLTGAFSAHSGDIGDSQMSILQLEVAFAADGTVAFNHRENSQSFQDFLEFRVDNTLFNSWSGITSLQGASFPIDAGNHTLEWRYTKDFFGSSGTDTVFIDDVVLTNGVAL